MITSEEIKILVASGEGYQAEWKRAIPSKVRDVADEVCAFANAAGGILLIGVNDDNKIVGGIFPNDKRSAIQNSLHDINPSIHINMYVVQVDDKEVLVIEVPSGKHKPYVFSGAIYVRQGPNTQKLTTAEQMRDFFQQSERIFFDEMPVSGFDISHGLDEEFFKLFRLEAGFPSSVEDDQIIKNLRLLTEDEKFKTGSVLFFAKSPDQYIEKAVIRCVAFDGYDKRTIVDSKDFKGPLHMQYTQSIQWLKNKLDVRYDIESEGSSPRKEVWEIPQTVFKEAIINALSHRDYYDKGARTTIELFKDRIEISNPGGLISGIKRSQFGKRSLSRNPLIFGLFERMDLVEQIGSGVIRIIELMREANLSDPQFLLEGMFTVILNRPVDFNLWVKQWTDDLTHNRVKIMAEIHKNNKVSKDAIGRTMRLGSTTIDNNIKWLRTNGFIDRIGGDRTGSWKLLYKQKGG